MDRRNVFSVLLGGLTSAIFGWKKPKPKPEMPIEDAMALGKKYVDSMYPKPADLLGSFISKTPERHRLPGGQTILVWESSMDEEIAHHEKMLHFHAGMVRGHWDQIRVLKSIAGTKA